MQLLMPNLPASYVDLNAACEGVFSVGKGATVDLIVQDNT